MPCSQPLSPSRFQGKEWIRSNARGHFPLDFMTFQAVPVEAVDASGCAINYQGLDSVCERGGDGRAHASALWWRAPERISVASPPPLPCSGPEGAPVPVAAALSPRG